MAREQGPDMSEKGSEQPIEVDKHEIDRVLLQEYAKPAEAARMRLESYLMYIHRISLFEDAGLDYPSAEAEYAVNFMDERDKNDVRLIDDTKVLRPLLDETTFQYERSANDYGIIYERGGDLTGEKKIAFDRKKRQLGQTSSRLRSRVELLRRRLEELGEVVE